MNNTKEMFKKKEPAIYAGSFDPLTYGHIDLIERMADLFQPLIILTAQSPWKKPYFSLEERVSLIKKSIPKERTSIEIQSHTGLVVDYARKRGVRIFIRGARLVSDFEYELAMSNTNKSLYPLVETFIAFTQSKYAHYSSKMVQEVALSGGDVSKFVPPCVYQAILKKQNKNKKESL